MTLVSKARHDLRLLFSIDFLDNFSNEMSSSNFYVVFPSSSSSSSSLSFSSDDDVDMMKLINDMTFMHTLT